MLNDFNWMNALYLYIALLITIIGCEMFFAYLSQNYVHDCIESNDLVDEQGNLIFNPLKYFDLLGTIIFPIAILLLQAPIVFGWSKSVRLDMQKLLMRYDLNSAILLSSGGIFFHFFISFLASILHSSFSILEIKLFLEYLIVLNVFLVVIKLCPVLPYDGLKILSYIGLKFGSDALFRFYWKIIPYGMIIFLVIAITKLNQIILIPAQWMLYFLL